jgi:hypothetical protein
MARSKREEEEEEMLGGIGETRKRRCKPESRPTSRF